MISEPSAIHSPKCSYQFTKLVFDSTVYFTYSLYTIVFGGLLAFLYGLFCGALSFVMIWVIAPFVRLWLIPLGLKGKIWLAVVKCFCDCSVPVLVLHYAYVVNRKALWFVGGWQPSLSSMASVIKHVEF